MKNDYVVIEFNSIEDFLMQMETENNKNRSLTVNSSSNKAEEKVFEASNNKNNNQAEEYINTDLNDESQLTILPDFEKEDKEEQDKEKSMEEELSKIIQLESNSTNRIRPIRSRNENLNHKINCYRKSIMNSANYTAKKKEEFLAETSPTTINPFGRNWEEIENEIKEKSAFRNFETYEVKNFIAKANDDLRQELMTMQLIKRFDDVFKNAEIPLKLRPYEILITSPTSGLIEFIPNSISIDVLKKKITPESSLNEFFRRFFLINFEEAQKNFAESLAAYSIAQHILNIKDRYALNKHYRLFYFKKKFIICFNLINYL